MATNNVNYTRIETAMYGVKTVKHTTAFRHPSNRRKFKKNLNRLMAEWCAARNGLGIRDPVRTDVDEFPFANTRVFEKRF